MAKKKKPEPTIYQVLAYMGIHRENLHQRYVWENWMSVVTGLQRWNGQTWQQIRPKLKTSAQMTFKTLNEYFSSCLAWGIVTENDQHVIWVGIPKGEKIPEPKTGKPFKEYPPPPPEEPTPERKTVERLMKDIDEGKTSP